MVSQRLERRIGQESVDGWRLESIEGERAVLKKPNYGSVFGHVLVLFLTGWWTFGLGNVVYAAYRFLNDSEYKIVSVEDPIDEEEALTLLRRRYARGEIDDDEFDRRLERLMEVESVEDARNESGRVRALLSRRR